ncbi:CBS domain-containing protein [Pseudobacteriovorax antillogorgiicola]|uniref:CBS domain-containing protein n=1 Tax=Pseudobacteriovorax antillogorgiicola TaxID=1513793 RepID=A0A1Y6BC05_9BACT|nr:CBS domain-containing protein [Pseudobacteriovorax antillogorgiicola]TCS57515.1 CBS domain-containing protein [Pseudobacteriovorax antillogorgiicola]SMF00148.1 CBS domain-containing protein [Pseudobacteriovorax antillogorgiicola]
MSKIRTNHPVSEIMTREPVAIDRTTKVSEVAKIFSENSFTHLPVLESGRLVGIVSLSDLLRVSYSDSFGQDERQVWAVLDNMKTIDDLMTQNPTTINPKATLRDAAKVLARESFHSLPVVDTKNEDFLGIITTTDIMEYLAEA